MNIEDKQELKKYLKRGDIGKICKQADVTLSIYRKWMSDVIKESSIEKYIVALVDKRKQDIKTAVENI